MTLPRIPAVCPCRGREGDARFTPPTPTPEKDVKHMEHLIWNRPMETMDREQLAKLQGERLHKTIQRVYKNVPMYRERMQQIGLEPGDIRTVDDLKYLPFTQKTDLRDNYPFGLFAASRDEIVRLHASSGTTGKPIVVGYTQNDLDVWSELMARGLTSAGATRHDTVQVSYGYGLFTGGLGAHQGAERIGATVVPTSSGNTKRQIMLMQDFGTNVLCCTPSYALLIGETIQEMGLDINSFKLRAGVFGAEPWSEEKRRRIEELLHIDAIDIYGLSEIMGPGVATECLMKQGMHISEDHVIPEIIDPVTGEQLPYGAQGELVFTTITKEGFPAIRYRTHDICSLNAEKCDCGRTFVRMNRITGRTDDMLIIRGVNVFPTQVESVLINIAGVLPHYLLIVDRVNATDTLEIQVEVEGDIFSDEVRKLENLTKRIESELQSVLQLHARVKLVQPGTIERSEGKSKRVIDRRKI